MMYYSRGSAETALTTEDLEQGLYTALDALGARKKVLAVPPDITRAHSRAGTLTELVWRYYGDRLTDVLPALGTHTAMTAPEMNVMFGKTPRELFRVHNWRPDLETLGEVPAEFVHEVSEGTIGYAWPAQVNRMLVHGGHDLIL